MAAGAGDVDMSLVTSRKWEPLLQAKIVATEPAEGGHTVYVVNLTSPKPLPMLSGGPKGEWRIKRRFREFHALHEQVRHPTKQNF
jgi:hypothetical protein